MILETIVTTLSPSGEPHLAPMGIHRQDQQLHILPFRPSKTLDNLLATGSLVINYCDDVRVFAGCLTGHRDWPLLPTQQIEGRYLECALTHLECHIEHLEDDPVRPKLSCKVVHEVQHQAFRGFNRAQFAVLEAAILFSRVQWLPAAKIAEELAYLKIGLEKTAGEREWQAWSWLMEAFEQHAQEAL